MEHKPKSIYPRAPKGTEAEKAKAAELYALHGNYRKVAELMGRNEDTIARWVNPNRGEAQKQAAKRWRSNNGPTRENHTTQSAELATHEISRLQRIIESQQEELRAYKTYRLSIMNLSLFMESDFLEPTPENVLEVRESLKAYFNRLTADQLVDVFVELAANTDNDARPLRQIK